MNNQGKLFIDEDYFASYRKKNLLLYSYTSVQRKINLLKYRPMRKTFFGPNYPYTYKFLTK